jgi:hypothetical protein
LPKNATENPVEKASSPTLPQRTPLIRNSPSGNSGLATRADRSRNNPTADSPAIPATSTPVPVQPQSSVCTTPNDTRPSPPASSSTLAGSGRRREAAPDARDSTRIRGPTSSTPTTTGTLRKKTERQPQASTIAAPTVGPTAPATAAKAPQIATATGIRSRGYAARTSASDDGISPAAPTACSTRAPISHPTDGDSPHSADPRQKTAAAVRNVRLRPTRSASRPAGISSAATAIV